MGFLSDLFHSNYSKYSEYSDAHMDRKMDRVSLQRNAKIDERNAIRQRIKKNYDDVKRHYEESIDNLKREKYYSAFDYSIPENLLADIKLQMRRELDNEISRDRQELAEIDKMIARINELELQSRRE